MKIIPLFFFIIAGLDGYSQDIDSTIVVGEARINVFDQARQAGIAEAKRSAAKYRELKISIAQQKTLEQYKRTIDKVKIFLRRGVDTLDFARDMDEIRNSFMIAKQGSILDQGNAHTQRNLTVSNTIMVNLLREMVHKKEIIDRFAGDLLSFRSTIDSLSSDSLLYELPRDSAIAVQYIRTLNLAAQEVNPTDSAITRVLSGTRDLQTRVNLLTLDLRAGLEELELERKKMSEHIFDREFENIWHSAADMDEFTHILGFSLKKEWLAWKFYMGDNWPRHILLLLLTTASALFIKFLRNKVLAEGADPGKLLTRLPIVSAILLVFSLFQFVYVDPPFIFNFQLWIISTIALWLIFRGYITPYWMRFWIVISVLFLLAGVNNLVLQESGADRLVMAVLSIAGIGYCSYVLLTSPRHDLKEKFIIYAIRFLVVAEVLSLILNVYGRYNLSKTLLVTGFTGLSVAILFLWVVRLINEGLCMAFDVYKQPESRLFYINFNRIGDRAPFLFYVLLVLGWFVITGRNFYEFRQIAEPLRNFFTDPRVVGDYSFTVSGLVLFLLIITLSLILSKILSVFGDDHGISRKGAKDDRAAVSSWLLLIRIAVISLGLFLAIAAAGIPLDRITLILGALGVGIGLGLQGLVNNLVSGLIIAFERPVNVGDTIEVNNKPGVMKSIGFRSSVVKLYDGANLIIPNGDLLSQQLVNWTMGKNLRRVVLPVGVAYGSDLLIVKQLLMDIVMAEDRIAEHPAPIVAAKQFSASSIDFEIIYWSNQLSELLAINNNLIIKINEEFNKAGIVIPYPHHDVYIHSSPDKESAGNDTGTPKN